MNNQPNTTSITVDEQGKIMGGLEIRPKLKSIIDQIKESMKPTPTVPKPTIFLSF
jgi:hypothetical protein